MIGGCDPRCYGWFAHLGQHLDASFDSRDEVGERVFVLSVIGADALFFEEGFPHVIDPVLEEAHRPVSFSRFRDVAAFVGCDVDVVQLCEKSCVGVPVCFGDWFVGKDFVDEVVDGVGFPPIEPF